MNQKSNEYLPNERTDYEPLKECVIRSNQKCKNSKLKNDIDDPIVVNNIASQEFDYTEK